MENIDQHKAIVKRLFWLIKLRWIAIIGVIVTIVLVTQLYKYSLPLFPLCLVVLLLSTYNLVFYILLTGIVKNNNDNLYLKSYKIANLQISLDLCCLALLIHFSGGIENPFIFYFIFHIIIASIFLSRRSAFFQTTFAVFLFCLVVGLEYFGVLPHYDLSGFTFDGQYSNFTYISGTSFVFISTLYIAFYLTSSIAVRLKKREKELKEVNDLLMKNDQMKSKYVLRVTHDIKGHLAAIQSCIEPVTGGITGPLSKTQLDLLQRALDRTGKLLIFVKALLEITHIKLSGEMKVESFSFADMISDVINDIRMEAKKKNISVASTVENGLYKINGSQEYLQEAILNILANSLKYTPYDGKIDVRVFDKGNSIAMQIKDTGIGIPREEMPKVFDEFYRASNAKAIERDGTGLGLSITKRIIERHNGKIWVESEEGKGTVFNITLLK